MSDRSASPQAPPSTFGAAQRRIVLALTAVLSILAGLVISTQFSGVVADATADALYTVLGYLLVALVVPKLSAFLTAVVAFAASALVELAQLTGAPAALAELVPAARFVFGTTFVATDLLFYAAGAALAAAVNVGVSRLWRRGRPVGISRRP